MTIRAHPIVPLPSGPPKARRCPRCGRDRFAAHCGDADCPGILPAYSRFKRTPTRGRIV